MAAMLADEINLDFAPRRRDDVISVELDAESVVYADGVMLRLDAMATELWSWFDGTSTLRDMVVDLVAVFDTHPEVVTRDVLAFTRRAGALGLLVGVREEV